MGLAIIAFTMATPIGSAVAAPIYQAVGYYGTFGIVAGCHLVVIFYLLFFVKETVSIVFDLMFIKEGKITKFLLSIERHKTTQGYNYKRFV